MSVQLKPMTEFVETFNRDEVADSVNLAETQRKELVERFPLSKWKDLPLAKYALGQENTRDTFSWALEFGTKKIGFLGGFDSRRFKIYKGSEDKKWWYDGDFSDENEAWQAIRAMFCKIFELAKGGLWDQIDSVNDGRFGSQVIVKSLHCYFPDEIIPISSATHIAHFLQRLGTNPSETTGLQIVKLNRLLLHKLREHHELADWSTKELERFLYKWAPLKKNSSNSTDTERSASKSELELDPDIYRKIADALEHKGQVILFGPPGTGKTFTAQKFAKKWLNEKADQKKQTQPAPIDSGVSKSEQRRAWLVVVKPQDWSWDILFEKGKEVFHGGRIERNFDEIREGDIVFGYSSSPKGKIEAIARVSKSRFDNEDGLHCMELQAVSRIQDGPSFEDMQGSAILRQSESVVNNMRGTLFKLSKKESDLLAKLVLQRDESLKPYLKSDVLPSNGNQHAELNEPIKLTFHPSYSYEDFIEGFRPDETYSNTLILKLKDGVFKRVCKEAALNRHRKYLILIDEINRANIAKVFGEVMTIIEKDKREDEVELPQSNHKFRVPENVYIIGTMNTADRSIKLFDIALRRRFSFIEMLPDPKLLATSSIDLIDLQKLLSKLNKKLASTGQRDKQIGHSFFMKDGKPIDDLEVFARCFRQDIIPLLQEYCYENYADLANYIGKELIDVPNECLNQERIDNTDQLVDSLVTFLMAE